VDVEERRINVADAFVCRDDKVSGKQIILVDDVCTSGATLESCATALKDRGATSVWGLTLARDIRN
jgi:predicted amidophosphoribosyltransferase